MEKLNELSEWLNQDGIVWVKYNPIVAATLAVISLVFCFLIVRLARRKKKVAPVSEYERSVADLGVRMSETCRGRIVPELNGNESISNGVKQVLELNHQPSVNEVVELLFEAGIVKHEVNKEYLRNLVYAKMQEELA